MVNELGAVDAVSSVLLLAPMLSDNKLNFDTAMDNTESRTAYLVPFIEVVK